MFVRRVLKALGQPVSETFKRKAPAAMSRPLQMGMFYSTKPQSVAPSLQVEKEPGPHFDGDFVFEEEHAKNFINIPTKPPAPHLFWIEGESKKLEKVKQEKEQSTKHPLRQR